MTPIAATITAELLEREAPLRALEAALADAAAGRGSAVLIGGEPGIGKSALVTSFVSAVASSTRVLLGICDDLAVPRPLGPFRDLADEVPATVREALTDGRPPGEFATELVRELRRGPVPTALVVEDVHWADQATTDTLTIVARRLADLPVVLVLTLRPGELTPDHPLRTALDAMQRSRMLHVDLPPLSLAAVEQLAGDDAVRIHELSGGNPFFVTELIAHGTVPFPPSLANAVLGRVARLEPHGRELLELVSVVPGRVPTAVLDQVEPDWGTAAAEAERRKLVTSDGRHVRFRHELTRAAIRSSLPHGRRRRLHRRILDGLLELGADPADIVHHGEAAGATEVVAEHALAAARRAFATGSNREAYAHYGRAAELAAERLPTSEQLTLFEEYLQAMARAGLRVEVTKSNPYRFLSEQARGASETFGVKSVSVLARRVDAGRT